MRLYEGQEPFTTGDFAPALGMNELTIRAWNSKKFLNMVNKVKS